MRAVILAGGKGKRLLPYTKVFPKPMMPIGDKPIVEIILEQLALHGFHEAVMAVGHLSDLIRNYFNGRYQNGFRLSYIEEGNPLGTAGALTMLPPPKEPVLVLNGDILTTLNFRNLMEYHKSKESLLTIAVFPKKIQVEFGIVHINEDSDIIEYEEKPTLAYRVSAGVYVFSPKVWQYLRPNTYLDLPTLVKRLLQAGERVAAYPFDGYWRDIGTHEEYEMAIREFEEKKGIFGQKEQSLVENEMV